MSLEDLFNNIDVESILKKSKDTLGDKTVNDYILKLLNFRLADLFNDFETFNKVDDACKRIEVVIKSLLLSGELSDEFMFKEGKKNFELNVENYRKMIKSFENAMNLKLKEKSSKNTKSPH